MGVEHTTPSQPQRDSGRPSISVITSIIRSRAGFSTLISLPIRPSCTSSLSVSSIR